MGSAIVWILGIAIGSPHAMYQTVKSHHYNVTIDGGKVVHLPSTLYTCTQDWDPKMRSIYTLVIFFCEALIPTLVLTATTTSIQNHSAQSSGKEKSQEESLTKKPDQVLMDNSVNKTLMILTMSFIFCWIPFNVLNVLIDLNFFAVEGMNGTRIYLIFAVFHSIAMVSAPLSAVVYGYMTPSIRRDIFCFWKRRSELEKGDEEIEIDGDIDSQP